MDKEPRPQIERDEKGNIVGINVDSDLGNSDWLRTLRLYKEGKIEEARARFNVRIHEITAEEFVELQKKVIREQDNENQQ